MKSAKRKLALYLAVIMLLNMVLPIVPRFVSDVAAAPPEFNVWTGTAPVADGLVIGPHVIGGTEMGRLVNAPGGIPAFNPGLSTGVFMHWPLQAGTAAPVEDMYVLRFFTRIPDQFGDTPVRVEMTVMRETPDRLAVGFDLYLPILGTSPQEYRSVRDPLSTAVTDFEIRGAAGSPDVWQAVNQALMSTTGGFVFTDQWINDGGRWGYNGAGGFPSPPLGFNFTPAVTGYPLVPRLDGVFTALMPTMPPALHYSRLVPNFSIPHGGGFTFRYAGQEVMFRWNDNRFFVEFPDNIESGIVYEFELEYYPTGNAATYIGNHYANWVWARGGAVAHRPFTPNRSFLNFYFKGISGFGSFPFAHVAHDYNHVPWPAFGAGSPNDDLDNVGAVGGVGGVNYRLHTRPQFLVGLPAAYTERFSTQALIWNQYEDPAQIPVRPIEQPTAHRNGMVLHFNLPAFFNEDTMAFNYTNFNRVNGGFQLPVLIDFHAPTSPIDPRLDSFTLQVDFGNAGGTGINNVTLHPPTGGGPSSINPADMRDPIVSNGQVFIEMHRLPDSAIYERVVESFTGVALNLPDGRAFTRGPGNTELLANNEDPLYTFLPFEIIQHDILGHIVRIDPTYLPDGLYRLRTQNEPRVRPGAPFHPLGSNPLVPDLLPTAPNVVTPAGAPPGETWFTVNPASGFVEIPIPPHPTLFGRFIQIGFMRAGTTRELLSQVVWHFPGERVPNIPLPGTFLVNNEHPNNAFVPAELPGGVPGFDLNRGTLTIRTQWQLGAGTPADTIAEFVAMLYKADPTFNTPIYVDYLLEKSRVPDDGDPAILPPPYSYNPFVGIRMTITPTPPTAPATVPTLEFTFQVMDMDGTGALVPPGTGNLPFDFNHIELVSPTAPVSTPVANLFFEVQTIHRNLAPEYPNNGAEFPFHFPGNYFMFARALRWVCTADPTIGGEREEYFRTNEDSFVISEMPRLQIPGPRNLVVTAVTDNNEAYRYPALPPALNVRFTLPFGEMQNFMETNFPAGFTPLVTANVYIGAFLDSIDQTFFTPSQIDMDARIANSVNIVYDVTSDGIIDLSAHANLFRQGGTPNVVRIGNIPLIDLDTGIPIDEFFITNPQFLNPFRTPLTNIPIEYPFTSTDHPLAESAELFQPPVNNFEIRLTLEGLDENRRYYVFVDLVVVPYAVDSTGTPPEYFLRPSAYEYSAMSGIEGDITSGVPQVPGPDELDPPAPTGLNWRPVPPDPHPHSRAIIFWNPIPLPDIANLAVEYEIIRVEGGDRMTEAERRDRNNNLVTFMNSLAATNVKGWATNGEQISVTTGGPLAPVPANSTNYIFRRESEAGFVELEDHTLQPNRVYFFYVRSVYIVDGVRRVSDWMETTLTTTPVISPEDLRDEGGHDRQGFDSTSMRLVSWRHRELAHVLANIGIDYIFQYQLRINDEEWGPIITVPSNVMIPASIHPADPNRIFFMLDNLDPGTTYQMRVRLTHVPSGDGSLWTNIITFVTDEDQDDIDLDRDTDNWMNHLRRLLEELLRRPFWYSQNTASSAHIIYRPGARFAGVMGDNRGVAIPLHNTDVTHTRYYMPFSVMRDAINERRGFLIPYSDLEIQLAPGFLNFNHNQVLLDMVRLVDMRSNDYQDAFVRIDITRQPMVEINSNPSITRQTVVSMSAIATAGSFRDLNVWDGHIHSRATTIVNNFLNDPVMRQNVRNMLTDGYSNEELLDWVHRMVSEVDGRITGMVSEYMGEAGRGILTPAVMNFTNLDAPMHIIVTDVPHGSSVTGYVLRDSRWMMQNLNQLRGGHALTSSVPGTFAFTGREIIIRGVDEIERGRSIHAMVARFGLDDFFSADIHLSDHASRYTLLGSVARIAGAPRNVDQIEWVARNLNMTLTSRNPDALISNQEAIAAVMALYERRTGTTVNNIRIRNFRTTSGMNLDRRYAQAVRAAFEIGIVVDTDLNPSASITVGEFLDMLGRFNDRVRV